MEEHSVQLGPESLANLSDSCLDPLAVIALELHWAHRSSPDHRQGTNLRAGPWVEEACTLVLKREARPALRARQEQPPTMKQTEAA